MIWRTEGETIINTSYQKLPFGSGDDPDKRTLRTMSEYCRGSPGLRMGEKRKRETIASGDASGGEAALTSRGARWLVASP